MNYLENLLGKAAVSIQSRLSQDGTVYFLADLCYFEGTYSNLSLKLSKRDPQIYETTLTSFIQEATNKQTTLGFIPLTTPARGKLQFLNYELAAEGVPIGRDDFISKLYRKPRETRD